MITATHNSLVTRFFDWYILRIMRKDFHSITVLGKWESKPTGSLVIGNHFSWWDGFFGLYLNNRFLKKHFFVMMLESQLQQRIMFSKAGAFSVNPGSRSVVESLNYAACLLESKENMVLIFPQGILHSLYCTRFSFASGVEKVLRKTPSSQLLFYVAMIEYFSNRKPSLFFYLKEVNSDEDDFSTENVENQYNTFYAECLEKHTQRTE